MQGSFLRSSIYINMLAKLYSIFHNSLKHEIMDAAIANVSNPAKSLSLFTAAITIVYSMNY